MLPTVQLLKKGSTSLSQFVIKEFGCRLEKVETSASTLFLFKQRGKGG
jgi:hypothetical protein